MQSLLYSLLAGLSTVLGALILLFVGVPGKRFMSILLEALRAVMTVISLFELRPNLFITAIWQQA